jgi:type III pantothenate kinase
MLLTIDIGNTNATLGVYDGAELLADWRLTSGKHLSRDELGLSLVGLFAHAGIPIDGLEGVCLASVVPPLTSTYTEACLKYLRQSPLVVELGVKTGVKVLVSEPRTVGADRIVNACAVKALVGGPSVVVDFGTATTFDAIDNDGNYLGGAIAPGLEVAADSLSGRTAKLPKVDLTVPSQAIGRNTIDALRSGIMFGYVALVEGMIARFEAELLPASGRDRLTVVATGGLAVTIATLTTRIDRVEPTLTLEGLRLIWSLNR